MRNVPLDVQQTFFLTNEQESKMPDDHLVALIQRELNRRPVKVKRIERDAMGCVNRIELDIA
jgi:hypothetical protein